VTPDQGSQESWLQGEAKQVLGAFFSGRCARCAFATTEGRLTGKSTGERRAWKLACGVRRRAGGKGLLLQYLTCGLSYCPGNHQSAGKQIRGTTRKGDRGLRQARIEAAQGAMRTKDTYLSAQGRRLTHRRGKKRAVVAVGHTMLIIAYHVLQRQQPYQDLGSNSFDERERSTVARQSIPRLEQLGFKVTLETAGEAA
jgi:hypothetical protein